MTDNAHPKDGDAKASLDWVGFALLVLVLALLGALILFRAPIVAMRPNLAGLYAQTGLPVNVRGLTFEDLDVIRDVQGGTPGLVIEGGIRNVAGKGVPIPALRLALLGQDGQELSVQRATAAETELAAGQSIRFRTRIASPPDAAKSVVVRFSDGSKN